MATTASEQCYWNATAKPSGFPQLEGDLDVDVAIIGGGIVGVSSARFMKDRGLTVALVEAHEVGRRATGRSTAKVTSQHGIIYNVLIDKFGHDRARLYADAQQSALHAIRRLTEEHEIGCDLQTTNAYVYTRHASEVSKLETEAEAARSLGLPAELVGRTDLPFPVQCAVRFDDQAQFHPTDYVAGLAKTIPGNGSHVFENSRAIDWQPDRVSTEHGSIKARFVVMATQLPLGKTGLFYARAYPQAEPVIAAPIGNGPEGMFLSLDQPSHSLRTHMNRDGRMFAIAAGPHFKPGHVEELRQHFREIERWLDENFDTGPVEHRWVNEDYHSMDSAPYVGWSSPAGKGYLVATGFHAWGLTNGTAAGMILADLADGRENEWLGLFDARRIEPVEGGGNFVRENVHAASHLVSGYLSRKLDSADEVGIGEAGIVKSDGDDLAVFRDEHGRLHSVSAVCSHMGCIVGWNDIDRTWDCPCHGSRFSLDGEVLQGPASSPLARR